MDTHIYHAFNVNDMASNTPACDKAKQVAHENLACRYVSCLAVAGEPIGLTGEEGSREG